MADSFRNLIGGEWLAGATTTPNRNPSDLKDVIGEYAQADVAQTTAAIAAAKAAFPAWATGSIQERANILDRAGSEILERKDELGRLLSREEGKTLPEGVGEAARAGYIFKFFAGEVVRLTGDKVPSVRPGIEDRARARLRQHRRDETGRPGSRLRLGDRRYPGPGRCSRGRAQPGDGTRLDRRRDARESPGCRSDQLHRIGRHRPRDRGEGHHADGQAATRNGRQE